MQDILSFLQYHWLLSAALIIIFLFLMILEFAKIRRGSNRLSPAQVTQLINHENAAIIDVRSPDMYVTGHVISSLSMPTRELNDKIKRIEKFKAQPVIIVCATGVESTQAQSLLEKNGFLRTYVLEGGIRAWKAADMPLVKD